MDFSLYPISLREPLPCILAPLTGDDPDVLLDLQLAFNQAYVNPFPPKETELDDP